MLDNVIKNEMNRAYYALDIKRAEIITAFYSSMLQTESGWFNGHYNRNESGDWERDSFPIAEVTVKGLCDIEIGFDKISVSTNLKVIPLKHTE